MPEGLLAAGASVTVERLTQAYRQGIFPWFNPGDPVLWWSPDPRMVLNCDSFKVSRSLAKKLRQIARLERSAQPQIRIMTDTAFSSVIQACAQPRAKQHGTWISPAIQRAYQEWHEAGHAHSIETWIDGQLAGGLYGVCIGRFFFGESMFARVPDASKLALAYLVRFLRAQGVSHIDCQQQTSHLASLGASPISRAAFLKLLEARVDMPPPEWRPGQLLADGALAPIVENAV